MKNLKKYSIFSLLFAAVLSMALCFTASLPEKANADYSSEYFKEVSVSLTDSTVLKYTVTLPDGYTSAKMTYTYGFGEGTTEEEGVVSEDNTTASFAFDKISPEFYAEKVTAKLTLEGEGKDAIYNEKDYSVAEYLKSLIRSDWSYKLSEAKTQALKKLAVDMLYLGDEAQDYVAGDAAVEVYATADLTNDEKALRSQTTTAEKPENYKTLAELNTNDSKVFYLSRGAEFTSKLSMKFAFTVKGEVGEITVKANDENVIVTPANFTVGENEVSGYSVVYDKIFAELYGKNITFKICEGDEEISSFEYGLAHFNYAFSTDEKAKNVAAEAYAYGVSAAEFKNASVYDFYEATRDCVTSGTTQDYYYNPENGCYYKTIGGDAVTPSVDIAYHEKNVDNTWHTCEYCRTQYLATRDGGGKQSTGRKKYVLLPGKDPFSSKSYIEKGTESDYTTSYNLKKDAPQTYTFTIPESDSDSCVKISVNMRNTNKTGDKNLEFQLSKTLHLYLGSVSDENEVAISDSAVLKPQLEGYNTYVNYELATVDLPENRTIILQFVYPGEDDASQKARGGYLCYLHIEKTYSHAWDVARYKDESTHTLTCLSCGKVQEEAHEHTDGATHLIIAKAPSKVWYTVGETLDTERMELYTSTVCAKGCKNAKKLSASEYTVEYINGNAFASGDTYVTLKHTESGATAKLPVYVTEEGKTITVDNKDTGFTMPSGAKARNNDQGSPAGQSGYGGSYVSDIKGGVVAKFTFTLDEAEKGKIVLQASSNRVVTGTADKGSPEYALGMCVNDVMVITVNGKTVELSYDAILKGSVSNLEANNNRWVWTNWTSVDLGMFDLKVGENVVEIKFVNKNGYGDTYNNQAVGQLDCLNVFFDNGDENE